MKIQKIKVQVILHKFYEICTYSEDGKRTVVDLDFLPNDNDGNYEVESTDDAFSLRDGEIDLGMICSIYDKLRSANKFDGFDKILLVWAVDGNGYTSHYRIEGKRMETDEEFLKRKLDMEAKEAQRIEEKKKNKELALKNKIEQLEKLKKELELGE